MSQIWNAQQYFAETDPLGDPFRFIIKAPVGVRIVHVVAQGSTPVVLAMAPDKGPLVDHPFRMVLLGNGTELLIGKRLGDAWVVELDGGTRGTAVAIIAQELPWPEAKKFMLESA